MFNYTIGRYLKNYHTTYCWCRNICTSLSTNTKSLVNHKLWCKEWKNMGIIFWPSWPLEKIGIYGGLCQDSWFGSAVLTWLPYKRHVFSQIHEGQKIIPIFFGSLHHKRLVESEFTRVSWFVYLDNDNSWCDQS